MTVSPRPRSGAAHVTTERRRLRALARSVTSKEDDRGIAVSAGLPVDEFARLRERVGVWRGVTLHVVT
jgi:hypothetical protein